MSDDDPSILGQAHAMLTRQELERVEREKAGRLSIEASHDHRTQTTTVEGSVQRTWGQWAASVWGKWTRKPGPDDGAIGGKVERKW